jgi:hypothetical protein
MINFDFFLVSNNFDVECINLCHGAKQFNSVLGMDYWERNSRIHLDMLEMQS